MIEVLLVLIVIGVLLWLVQTRIPMVDWMRTVITVVAVIFVLLYLASVFGLMDVAVPRWK
ncbi:hypothetical protein BH24ACT15_BH24ACT15_30700 [soil metagenome]